MTKRELVQMARTKMEEAGVVLATDIAFGFTEGFEACYRLLTTPRPMSEAPRDGFIQVIVNGKPVTAEYAVDDLWISYDPTPWEEQGWLPIFTPLEEDANG